MADQLWPQRYEGVCRIWGACGRNRLSGGCAVTLSDSVLIVGWV